MARPRTVSDVTTLQMALVGYQIERQKIDEKIREIEAQLRGRRGPVNSAAPAAKRAGRRPLSPAARRRISAAQKKRWAAHRKQMAQSKKES
jgi:hypothetical protein